MNEVKCGIIVEIVKLLICPYCPFAYCQLPIRPGPEL